MGKISKLEGGEMGSFAFHCCDSYHVHGWVGCVRGRGGIVPVSWRLKTLALISYVKCRNNSYSWVCEVPHVGSFWILTRNEHNNASY